MSYDKLKSSLSLSGNTFHQIQRQVKYFYSNIKISSQCTLLRREKQWKEINWLALGGYIMNSFILYTLLFSSLCVPRWTCMIYKQMENFILKQNLSILLQLFKKSCTVRYTFQWLSKCISKWTFFRGWWFIVDPTSSKLKETESVDINV